MATAIEKHWLTRLDPTKARFRTYLRMTAPATNGNLYFWEIIIPGMIVGLIVGYATQKHEPKRTTS